MSLRRSLRLIGSGPVVPVTTKGRLSFSAIKIFDDDENEDELENEPALAQDLPVNALPKLLLAAPDFSPRFRIGQPAFGSDYVPFSSDLGGPANPSSNHASLHGINTSISSYFDHVHNDRKFVESELEAINRHRLPTPQLTPDPPSASTLTSDLSFIGESRVDAVVETPKSPYESKEPSARYEGLIIEPADLHVPSRNLNHMRLAGSDPEFIMNLSQIGESMRGVFARAHDRKTPSPEVLTAKGDLASSTTSNESMYEMCPISKPASAENHLPDLHDVALGSSKDCGSPKPGESSKQKRKKHKREHCGEAQKIPTPSLEDIPLDQNRNSLAEYRRQMLSRHRRIDHRPPRKSIFVTIRRDWYS